MLKKELSESIKSWQICEGLKLCLNLNLVFCNRASQSLKEVKHLNCSLMMNDNV